MPWHLLPLEHWYRRHGYWWLARRGARGREGRTRREAMVIEMIRRLLCWLGFHSDVEALTIADYRCRLCGREWYDNPYFYT